MGGETVDLSFNFRGQRDDWFEKLTFSKATADKLKASRTGNPRHIGPLMLYFKREGIQGINSTISGELKRLTEDVSSMNNTSDLRFFIEDKLSSFLFKVLF